MSPDLRLRVTTYAYPWDLARLGVDETLREMVDSGIESIDLAGTYHPIDALSPRGGMPSLYTNARGAVHFPARVERYGRIRPSLSSAEVCAAWPETALTGSALGLGVNAWLVVLYQPWIVDAYPDCARVLASGDANPTGVCPANDDVREYLVELSADLVDQFGVDMIRLEGILAAGYDYGWLRPRVLVDVPPLVQELLAVCFCPSCIKRGHASGLDVARVRQRVVTAVTAALTGDSSAAVGPMENLLEDVELHAFVALHERASVELAKGIRSRVGEMGGAELSAVPWSPFRDLGADKDALLGDLLDTIDQLALVPGYDTERIRRVTASRTTPVSLSLLMVPPRPGSSKSNEFATQQLASAKELGVREVGIYNYGLLPQATVSEFVGTLRSTFA